MSNSVTSHADTGTKHFRYLLTRSGVGFEQLYTELKSFSLHLKRFPELIDRDAVDILFSVIQSPRHLKQKQVYFLFRQAAEILLFIIQSTNYEIAEYAVFHLQKLVIRSKGKKQRALSEALGKLPIKIQGPALSQFNPCDPLPIKFSQLIFRIGNVDKNSAQWHGRTLQFRCIDGEFLCIKFAESKADLSGLAVEAQWLKYMRRLNKDMPFSSHVPRVISFDPYDIVMLTDIADQSFVKRSFENRRYAMVFKTVEAYYHYPNEQPVLGYDKNRILAIFEKNAGLAGYLASKGIVHTALIPLFHNRVQRQRREDNGIYLWEHGGRLDQWLTSCKFPNFAASGLRDFEHFISLPDSKRIHHFIGEHILGFILTIGSLFRNREPEKKGWDADGRPLDLQYLFDEPFFCLLLEKTILSYCRALTGTACALIEQMDFKNLTARLIQVMGTDPDMEESLRIRDQIDMSQQQFDRFLSSRGFADHLDRFKKGAQDIAFMSGPHLGGFNQPISVPELIEFLFCLSSISIAERYLKENALKGRLN